MVIILHLLAANLCLYLKSPNINDKEAGIAQIQKYK